MKIKSIISASLLILLLATKNSFATAKQEPKDIIPGLNQLKINPEISLTDNLGVVNPKLVSLLQVGDNIKMIRPDGTLYTGKITETQDSDDCFKVFGFVTNSEDTHFGFSMNKGGIFAGAIVEKKSDKVYALELSEAHRGYIFIYTTKYNKKLI
jgi:hypothetical protein